MTRRELNYKGLYATQGRNGWWFLSTGYDPRTGRQVPMDGDDEFLLSKHDIHDAYEHLNDRVESGDIV